MRTSFRIFTLLAAGTFVSAPTARAESLPRPKVYTAQTATKEIRSAVQMNAWLEANQIRSELTGKSSGFLEVSVQIEAKNQFKLYEDKLLFWTEADPELGNQEWKVEILQKPAVHLFMDPVSKSLKPGFKGESLFRLRLSLPDGGIARALPLNHKLLLNVGFQACSDTLCLFPSALQLEFEVTNAAKVAASQKSGGLVAQAAELFAKYLGRSEGGLGFSPMTLLLLILAGVLTAFTPCVYPLYPITLGIFSRWGQQKSSKPFALVLAYCGGIILSYATIGLLSAASGAIFGSLTQTPFFLIGVGTLILASALVFSGLVDLKALSWLQNRFSRAGGDESQQSATQLYAKAFGMGAVLGLVASPCVGPVLIALLAWLSTQLSTGSAQSYAQGFLLFAVFGFGMSLPFLVLGHLVLKMGSRPSLGKYTPVIKHVGTLLMVVASFYFLIPGIGLLRIKSQSTQDARYPVHSLVEWTKTKPTVMDFRADWCAACIELEHETFAEPEISKNFESGEWDFVRIDMTQGSPENSKIASDFDVRGLPTVLISDSHGKICKSLSLFGFETAKVFKQRMAAALKACE